MLEKVLRVTDIPTAPLSMQHKIKKKIVLLDYYKVIVPWRLNITPALCMEIIYPLHFQ